MKWSVLLARICALILFISIWIFDFGPKKLSGPWRNGPQDSKSLDMQPNWDGFFLILDLSLWENDKTNQVQKCSRYIVNAEKSPPV